MSTDSQQTNFRLHRRGLNRILVWVTLGCLLLALGTSEAWGQASPLPALKLQPLEQSFEKLLSTRDVEVATSRIQLDGYTLFVIAAPSVKVDSSKSDSLTPIALRRQTIEQQLKQIANSNIESNTLNVTSTLDKSSGLPVISVNGQYLMTVTDLDAQLQGATPTQWASDLTTIVRTALLRAHQERQPSFLIRQGLWTAGISLILILLSRFLARRQRHLKRRRKQMKAQIVRAPDQESLNSVEDLAFKETGTTQPSVLAQQRHRNLLDLRLRSLQIAQVVLWGCGTFVLLGLFPQTRWLRPLLLSTPLQILGIALGIYMLTRLSDVLVDQLFRSIQSNEFIPPEASQRLTLRISTIARVIKSTTALLWIGAGLLAGLSLLGVNLLPLLAGAGIIGLALSFAAQSVIKDVINGFLILFEDQYAVGDVIAVGTVGGMVENINLRITQLRNSEGMLITIPNSQISTVQNLSQGWSRVDLTIQVSHSTDPDYALQSLKRLADELYQAPQWRSKLLEPPDILGIESLDQAGMSIRIWIKTQPLQQWVVAREFRRRLKKLMINEGISIGIPQQSISLNKAPKSDSVSAFTRPD